MDHAGDHVLHEAQGLRRLQLAADLQDVTEVAPLHKLHDDVILLRDRVLGDGQRLDDVGVAQVQADVPLALEQVDGVVVLAPAPAQHLDGNDAAALWLFGPVDAAEAA